MEKLTTIEKVKEFAYSKHNLPSECQRYGAAPYSKHLCDVEEIGMKYSYYISKSDIYDVLCAINFHDLVEDTDVTIKLISKLTNDRVADIVYRVTNERGYDRKEKNFKTYPKIWPVDLAIYVKLCDRIANTKNSKNSGHSMYNVYKEEYPLFKYALNVRNLYPDMWEELDNLNEIFK